MTFGGHIRPDESGAATVSALAWILVLATVAFVGMVAAAVTARQHRVDGAADLVAVSAASGLREGSDACGVARDFAARNKLILRSCKVDGSDVVIVVADTIDLVFGVRRSLVGRARAGPADS